MIDFDNVTMGIRSDLQRQLKALLNSEVIKGKVAVQRAYADWRRYPQYIVPLSEASIDLIFAPAFGSNKKNATDIRLAIDCLELVFTRPEIGVFILLSGDSDFSSLVLKLREYGKYVIGVGLRESSSDLLIQNCDEYYSYTELTGLTKEGEFETPRRDPWELVVEAVMQMKRDDDVMRSDRLKQVMQTIDPNFDEKDVGFSRFSKFVQEASQRGLLKLSKLENGQFGVDVGTNANVPPEEPEAPKAPARKGRGARRTGGLTLAEGFELLRQALMVLEAVGENAVEGDAVREKMVELFGDEHDPMLDRGRLQRLLRQAHDAELIELTKNKDGYRLKLRPEAMVTVQATGEPATPETEVASKPGEEPARPTRRRGGRGRGGRSRRGTPNAETGESAPQAAPKSTPKAQAAAHSGSPDRRGLGPRRGRRGGASGRPAEGSSEGRPIGKVEQPARSSEPRATPVEAVQPAPPPPPEADAAEPVGGSLFRRMSAALQRVVRGPEGEEGEPRE